MNEFTVGVWAVTGLLGEIGYVCGEVEGALAVLPNATLVGTVNVEGWDDVRPLWSLLASTSTPASATAASAL